MRPATILKLSAALTLSAVLGGPRLAHAQAQPAPAPAPDAAAPPPTGAPPPEYQAPPPGYQLPPGYQPPPGYQAPQGYPPPPSYPSAPNPTGPPGYGQPPPYYPPPGYGRPAPYYAPAPYPMSPRSYERRGLVLGFGLGFGSMGGKDCVDCGGSFGAEFHLGALITPRLALMYDVSTAIHPIDDLGTDVANTVHTMAAQIWLTRPFWVKAGVGLGHLSVTDNVYTYKDQTAGAFMVGAGIELLQGPWFALDLQARYAYAGYQDGYRANGLLLIGFNWY